MDEACRSFQPTIMPSGLLNFGLSIQSSAPCSALQDVVHSYLQIKAEKPTLYPIIPDGTQSIFISSSGLIIGGAQTQIHEMKILAAGEYFGIRFYSGVLRHFFKLDLAEITDQFVDHSYFPCRNVADLQQAIYQDSVYQKRVNICEQWLLQHYKPQENKRFEQAMQMIYQSSGSVSIDDLANQVDWSSRHLNRLFRLHTGLSTKGFSSIIRLQHACKQLYAAPCHSPSHLELDFFDQSHLIKNFRKHLLSKPSTFFNRFKSDLYNQ